MFSGDPEGQSFSKQEDFSLVAAKKIMVTDDNKIQRNRENKLNTQSKRIQESDRKRDEPSVKGSNHDDRLNDSKELQDT